MQPASSPSDPGPGPPLPWIRGDPARVDVPAVARWTVLVPPRERSGCFPSDREILPPRRGGVSRVRTPLGPPAEVLRAPVQKHAADVGPPEPAGRPAAERLQQPGKSLPGGGV